ncbi:MAG: TrmH family RNA methyltransferase, partial [Lachnospiraceae bacterium]|nr:TrmH family RNA methyltransferase [Lachnospiraceae bacterium]
MDLSIYKPYKKDFDFSYTLGAFPTMELIKKRPESVRCVFIHSKYDGSVDFSEVCRKNNIEVVYNDKIVNRIASKDNCFVIGVFDKFSCELNEKCNHVLLVNPSDMGNLGTIIRTLTGLGIYDLGI